MLGRNKGVKDKVSGAATAVRKTVSDYADPLAHDEKLRERLVAALATGAAARQRARRQLGVTGAARRLASDQVLRAQLAELAAQVRAVQKRTEKPRSHKLRNTVLFAAGVGMVVAAIPAARQAVSSLLGGGGDRWADEGWPSDQAASTSEPLRADTTAVVVNGESQAPVGPDAPA
jgi:hypothetical protein